MTLPALSSYRIFPIELPKSISNFLFDLDEIEHMCYNAYVELFKVHILLAVITKGDKNV